MLLCFFLLLLFRVVFNNFFTIPVVIKSTKLKLALDIPTCLSITVLKETIDIEKKPPKQNNQRQQCIC